MYGQWAQSPLTFNYLLKKQFPQLIFFKSILSSKNWGRGGELLLKNGKLQ